MLKFINRGKATMQLKESHKTICIVTIVIVLLLLLGCGAVFYWYNQPQPESAKDTETTTSQTKDKPQTETNNSAGTTTDNDNAAESTYVPGKTPEQYDNQTETNDAANSIEYNNEQFRIPGDEL
jgi:cytoskeletal protein RodZ